MKRYLFNTRTAVLLGLLACVSLPIGCRASAPPSGSVSGKVTYNGQPLTIGVITFINEKAGIGASSDIDASGNYHIVSIRTGEYNVAVYRRPPAPGEKDYREWETEHSREVPGPSDQWLDRNGQ